MTIQEAIKSGKEFKRAHWHNWNTAVVRWSEIHAFVIEDILADDWEVKQ